MKRITWMRSFFVILLFLLAGRLYYVQILCSAELTEAAHRQQMISVLQQNAKGTIYDRNMNPITGTASKYYYMIHCNNLTPACNRLLEQIQAELVGRKGEEYLIFQTETFLPAESRALQERWQALGFCVDNRYSRKQIASPLVADLDQMYEAVLTCNEPLFYFQGNAVGTPISGLGMVNTANGSGAEPAALVTSIDGDLQQNTECIFAEEQVAGCAVVTDTHSGQILAMVSRANTAVKGEEAEANLTVENAYDLGVINKIVRDTAKSLHMERREAAMIFDLGETVFDGYPGENAGTLPAKNHTKTAKIEATAAQVSRLLTILANEGKLIPLTIIMSASKEDSIPCMISAEDDLEETLQQMHQKLTETPLADNRWAVGFAGENGRYAITIHTEKGNAKSIFDSMKMLLEDQG